MDHSADVEALDRLFTASLSEHGESPEAVQWSSRETQERRMSILTEVADLKSASVLDFGCGTGHLLRWLREHRDFAGQYVGYDIAAAMVDRALEHHAGDPSAHFERRNILTDGVAHDVDVVIVNGTFNNRVTDNWLFMTDILRELFPHARVAMAFNCMSSYVGFTADDLSYQHPEDLFRFCKSELSPRVTLRHDYEVKPGVLPFEFTTYVYASEIAPLPPIELPRRT